METTPIDFKKLSIKNIVTTAVVMLIVFFLINFIKNDEMQIKDKEGNLIGTGQMKTRYFVKGW